MSNVNNESFEFDIFFTIEERPEPGPKSAKVLIDNEGYICGVFATYKLAKEAMPRIRRNLIREFKRRAAKAL